MIRTALIGVSGYAREHLRLLMRGVARGEMACTAAVVINPEEEAQTVSLLKSHGCRIYDSVGRLFAEENGDIDLCMIPTPISTHYPFAMQALAHGCHVFLEKPACGTLAEAADLARAADAAGRHVFMGFQDIYSPQVQIIKRRLVAGDFGRVRSIRCWGNWPRPIAYYQRNGWAGKLRDRTGWVLDSPANNAMAHFLNLVLYWAGPSFGEFARPDRIEGDLYRAQPIESFDTASLRAITRDGIELLFACSHSGEHLAEPRIRISCERGEIEWTHCGPVRIRRGASEDVLPQPGMDVLRDGMMDAVVQRLQGKAAVVVSLRDALAHTACVNALHDASAIQDIPASLVSLETGHNGSLRRTVPGLTALLERAFTEGRLLKELPLPWPAAAGRTVDLTAYTRFAGGFQPAGAAPANTLPAN